MTTHISIWIGSAVFVLAMLALDLKVFHRRAHRIALREAAVWTAVWVGLALAFNSAIYAWFGPVRAVEFLTGYLIEWSLSMDNVFVFALIFSYFAVPPQYQHRVLFWGILGAVAMRLVLIVVGAALLDRFEWLIYLMGGFLVVTGVKLFFDRNTDGDITKNLVMRLARGRLPLTENYVVQKFFVRQRFVRIADGAPASVSEPWRTNMVRRVPLRWFRGWVATPLVLVLLVVESSDVAFAFDSIPAIFTVTRDPFIAVTSNVFAILGLRALYFLLASALGTFRYLSIGLAAILCFVGTKMLVSRWYELPIGTSLAVVCGILIAALLPSAVASRLESGRWGLPKRVGEERVRS